MNLERIDQDFDLPVPWDILASFPPADIAFAEPTVVIVWRDRVATLRELPLLQS